MPPKLPKCAICSTTEAGKYRCPVDGVDYCSVKCFKQHKLDGCTKPTSYEPSTPAVPPQEPTPAKALDDANDSDRPRKKLKDLRWPVEPDPSLWLDPLARDDVKPLRPFEYEAIATSPTIRRLLLSNPSLISTLTRLVSLPPDPIPPSFTFNSSSLKDPPRPGARETSMRLLLGLPSSAAPIVYRPGRGNGMEYRTASGNAARRGGRGGAGFGAAGGDRRSIGGAETGREGLVRSTPEERKLVQEFVDEVENVLNLFRGERGEKR